MPDISAAEEKQPKKKRKLLRLFGVFMLLVFILSVAAIGFLPTIFSLPIVRKKVEAVVSAQLKRPVALRVLHWKWSEGLVLGGLSVPDDPEFSHGQLVSLERLNIDVDFISIFSDKIVLKATLDGLDVNVIRSRSGETNIQRLLSTIAVVQAEKAPGPAVATPEEPGPSADARAKLPVIPMDLDLLVRFSNLNLSVEDQAAGQAVRLSNLSFFFKAPSIVKAPVSLELNSEIALNGKALDPIDLKLRLSNFVDVERQINVMELNADIAASAPGLKASVKTDMASDSLKSSVEADLPVLADIAKPFLPADLSNAQIAGSLTLESALKGLKTQNISFDSNVAATGLAVSGSLVQGKAVGPIDFLIYNRGSFDHKVEHVEIEEGGMVLNKAISASWRASANGLKDQTQLIDLNLGPVEADLAEVLSMAGPFVPEGIELKFDRPAIRLKNMKVAGALPSGSMNVQISDMTLALPAFLLAVQGDKVDGQNFAFSLSSLSADFIDLFPSAANMAASLNVEALRLDGPAAVEVYDFNLEKLELDVNDVKKTGDKGLGLAFGAKVDEALKVGKFRAAGQAEANGVREELSIFLQADKTGALKIDLERLNFSAATASARAGENISVSLSTQQQRPGLSFSLSDGAFHGPASLKSNSVGLKKLSAGLAGLDLFIDTGKISLASADFLIRDLTSELKNSFPSGAELSLAVGLKDLSFADGTGAVTEAEVESLTLDVPILAATKLRENKAAAFGWSAEVRIDENIAAKGVKAMKALTVAKLTQSLKAVCLLSDKTPVSLNLEKFNMESKGVSYEGDEEGASWLSVSTDLSVNAHADSVMVKKLSPLLVDAKAFKASLELGEMLSAIVNADVEDSAGKSARTKGSVDLNLTEIARLAEPLLPGETELGGTAAIVWDADARKPAKDELAVLTSGGAEPSELRRASAFLKKVLLSVNLNKIHAAVPLGQGKEAALLRVEEFSTQMPFTFAAEEGVKSINLSTAFSGVLPSGLSTDGVNAEGQRLPALPPMTFSLDFALDQKDLASVNLAQNFNLEPFGLKESIKADLFGMDKLLKRGFSTPPALWTEVLGGAVEASVSIGSAGDQALSLKGAGNNSSLGGSLDGSLEGRVKAKLAPSEEVSAQVGLYTKGLNLNLDKTAEISNFQSTLSLEKRYRLGRLEKTASSEKTPPDKSVGKSEGKDQFLSSEVLSPPGAETTVFASRTSFHAMPGGASVRRQVGVEPSLSFSKAKIEAGPTPPFPIELTNYALDIRLDNGLPALDSFRIDVLGGTVMGALGLSRIDDEFLMELSCAFSGLNMKRLAPGLVSDIPDDEAEISGRLKLKTPLSTSLSKVLERAVLNLRITKIGQKALERALFGLDPTESNEAVVEQRKLAAMGSPLWVEASIKHGKLRTDGEVQALGIKIRFPQILGGVNVGSLGEMGGLEAQLQSLGPMLNSLEKLSASNIFIDKEGVVEFVR